MHETILSFINLKIKAYKDLNFQKALNLISIKKKGFSFVNLSSIIVFFDDCKKVQCYPLAPGEVEIPRFLAWIVAENGTMFRKMANVSAPKRMIKFGFYNKYVAMESCLIILF